MGKKKKKQKFQVPILKEGIQTDVQPQRIETMAEELKQKKIIVGKKRREKTFSQTN